MKMKGSEYGLREKFTFRIFTQIYFRVSPKKLAKIKVNLCTIFFAETKNLCFLEILDFYGIVLFWNV